MHRLKSPAVTLLVTAFLVACGGGGDNGNDPKPQTTVVVSPTTQTRVAGETYQFSATVNGAASTAGQVIWSSTNTSVATVESATGLVTAVAAGTAKIRATVGTVFGDADLTVIANTAPSANAGTDADVDRSATVTLNGTGTDPQGQAITYKWTQIAGPDVTNGAGYLTGAAPSFTAPSTVSVVRFSLATSDGTLASAPDTVMVRVLEDHTHAFWVSYLGSDANAGTRAAPFKTIAAGITAAAASGGDVYVSEGSYPPVTLQNGVSIYGGFALDWSNRYPVSDLAHRSSISGAPTVLAGSGVADLTVDGFAIEASDATSGSSYGITLMNSQRVTISQNAIRAGNGSPGASGTSGANGAAGAPGGNANAEVTPAGGGTGPGGGGGAGGRGGTSSAAATAGQSGQGAGPLGTFDAGGQGGSAAAPPTPGGQGGNGANGSTGAAGLGGASFGSFNGTNYVPSAGATGATGNFGAGGGGGGGGGYVYFFPIGYNGGGAGGGGGGGLGGRGGGGGTGGGGSFGILLYGSTGIVIQLNTIMTGTGGAGGNGGPGGIGGPGGAGGAGFDPSATVDGREAGHGGDGGSGGSGGAGGGGGGGPAIAIVAAGGSTFTGTGNSYNYATGGRGGLPNGAAGAVALTREIP